MEEQILKFTPVSDRSDLICKPEVIQYLDFVSLVQVRSICKTFRDIIDKSPEDIDYWRSLCTAYCLYAGVYSSFAIAPYVYMDYKKYFFSELWTIRGKWAVNNDIGASSNQEYKILVANRFRPGTICSDKVCLPLHQFLKIKRHQKALKNGLGDGKSDGTDILVGEADPEEFVDPLLGTLMKDPVLLTTSQRVIDRSVAVQCVLRGGRDPFDGQRLTMAMLVPQPELAERIQEFRRRKQQVDVSVGRDELQPLVEDQAVDADLLEALLEVERMNTMARRAASEAAKDESNGDLAAEGNGDAGPEVEEAEVAGQLVDDAAVDPGAAVAEEILQANILEAQVTAANAASIEAAEGHYNPISRKVERAGIVEVNDRAACVTMHVPGAGVKPFHYSAVHKGDATQQQVYQKSAQGAVAAALNGFNACIMCYGQTGSGKTHTFFGPDGLLHTSFNTDERQQRRQREQQGMVLRACAELLQARELLVRNGISVSYTAQFVEIYEEQVTDLLTGQAVSIRRETGAIAGAVEAPFSSMEQVEELLRVGHDRKRFAATEMNERSSRSHTALVIHVSQKVNGEKMRKFSQAGGTSLCDALKDCSEGGAGDRLLRSQLHLVDLAGSERVKKSKVEGVRLREAVCINSSLLVLGKVISGLVEGKSHVPYYESKLTTLLKAAFGGNSRTTVVINCRADAEHGDETLQSMRFGERCAMVSNSMRVAASSFSTALGAVDKALSTVQGQLASLEARNKQHLPSYKTLLHSFQQLDRKRRELIEINASQQVAAGSVADAVVLKMIGNQADADPGVEA